MLLGRVQCAEVWCPISPKYYEEYYKVFIVILFNIMVILLIKLLFVVFGEGSVRRFGVLCLPSIMRNIIRFFFVYIKLC